MSDQSVPTWIEGWCAAIEWLTEHKGPEGLLLAEEMRTRLPDSLPRQEITVVSPRLCSQCGECDSAMVKIGTIDGWCVSCLDLAAERTCPNMAPDRWGGMRCDREVGHGGQHRHSVMGHVVEWSWGTGSEIF